MRQKRTFILAAAVGLAVVLACEALLFTGGFEFLENRSFDLRVRLLPPPEPPPADIVIVDIDNPSFAALSEAVGRWPWTRLLWAPLPPPPPPPADFLIVALYNPSFAALSAAVGRWPWPGLLWADLAKFIQQG